MAIQNIGLYDFLMSVDFYFILSLKSSHDTGSRESSIHGGGGLIDETCT